MNKTLSAFLPYLATTQGQFGSGNIKQISSCTRYRNLFVLRDLSVQLYLFIF
ncbi:hypothetical protein PMEGAPR236_27460 [Priestia megaterium]